MNKVYLLTHNNDQYVQLLQNLPLPGLEIVDDKKEANIVIGAPPLAAKCLNEFTSLEWLQSTYAGIETLVQPELRQDYLLTNIKGIFGQFISEYVIGYCIQHYRHFPQYQDQQNKRDWQPHSYTSLLDKKMVILGTGSIGNYLAKAATAMGFTVSGVNRTGIPAKDSAFDSLYHINEIHSVLKGADVIVNTLPETSNTLGLLDKELFSNCQKVLFFNVGRGSTVNEDELIECIEAQYIEHAFLDVFTHEPLSQEHPYWSHDSITVTPHIAATSFPRDVIETFKVNYDRWCHGFSLENIVNFDKGY
ncbi:D-2-hydroxyacid dehydrogenase [Vibrio marisflavi]|nr:D-2-hydroxyacid dehydrogenase [Vibrio marisflavi]